MTSLSMENMFEVHSICKDQQQSTANVEETVLKFDEKLHEEQQIEVEDEPFPGFYEEASYHELRCISNNDYEEYDELDRTKHILNHLDHSCSRFCRKFSETSLPSSVENTDDQLFIEIVKEEIDVKPDHIGKNSILDSIAFNIDHEDNITEIKIIKAENNCPLEESTYLFFKKPEVTIPQRKAQVVRFVESKPRKPLKLANYRNLITEAINSSPEKRMILTDIYKWIIENVPFFRDKEIRGKNGWKNCVRHTLSVNERFIRIKNRTNIRSSYWTVCEEGDISSKLAAYPWVSEIFKPEERRRPRFKRKQKNIMDVKYSNLNTVKGELHINMNGDGDKPVKRKRGRPPINRNISENSNTPCQVNNTKTNKCQIRLRTRTKEQKRKVKILKDNKESKAKTKKTKSRNKTQNNKRIKQTQTVRRSSRKRVARKTWKL